MKIVEFILLLFCVMLVAMGVGLWWIPEEQMPTLVKLIYSVLCCGAGVAFGAMTIEMIIEDW